MYLVASSNETTVRVKIVIWVSDRLHQVKIPQNGIDNSFQHQDVCYLKGDCRHTNSSALVSQQQSWDFTPVRIRVLISVPNDILLRAFYDPYVAYQWFAVCELDQSRKVWQRYHRSLVKIKPVAIVILFWLKHFLSSCIYSCHVSICVAGTHGLHPMLTTLYHNVANSYFVFASRPLWKVVRYH